MKPPILSGGSTVGFSDIEFNLLSVAVPSHSSQILPDHHLTYTHICCNRFSNGAFLTLELLDWCFYHLVYSKSAASHFLLLFHTFRACVYKTISNRFFYQRPQHVSLLLSSSKAMVKFFLFFLVKEGYRAA